jgi:hypothetical protein
MGAGAGGGGAYLLASQAVTMKSLDHVNPVTAFPTANSPPPPPPFFFREIGWPPRILETGLYLLSVRPEHRKSQMNTLPSRDEVVRISVVRTK